jgi:hypothetical protein
LPPFATFEFPKLGIDCVIIDTGDPEPGIIGAVFKGSEIIELFILPNHSLATKAECMHVAEDVATFVDQRHGPWSWLFNPPFGAYPYYGIRYPWGWTFV